MIRSSVRAVVFSVIAGSLFWLAAWTSGAIASGSPHGSRPGALPHPAVDAPLSNDRSPTTVVFAGGCFWGVQAVFEQVKGVASATAGYAGGSVAAPSYELVSSGTTGHAESVRVVFDPSTVSFGQLLEVFFSVAHDPTELNRQGPDVGTQYRSAIFVTTAGQERIARAYIEQLTRAKAFTRAIVTEVAPLRAFYPAEAYHQDYARYHPYDPYIAFNDLPRLRRLKKEFPALYVENPH